MSEIPRDKAIAATQRLVHELGLPPQVHSIWLNTSVDNGDFLYKIMISKHPEYKGRWDIPKEIEGFQIEHVEWPRM